MIAHSLNSYFNQGGNFSFAEISSLSNGSGGKSELAELKVFEGGAQLQKIILQTNFNGIAGLVLLDKKGNLMSSAFEFINIAGKDLRSISFWSKLTGLSVTPPENTTAISNNESHRNLTDSDIIWLGQSKKCHGVGFVEANL